MGESPRLLLKGGSIVDGLGGPARQADLLIDNDRIADIGSLPQTEQFEIVDCAGLHIAPGFIDVHSHSDKEILEHQSNKVLQGVTTEVVGNCSFSLFPSRPNPAGRRLTGELFDGEPAEGMPDTEAYFSALAEKCSRVNVAALTGHGALRLWAMDARREPRAAELQEMERALDRCLGAGSIGFSTGLNCLPSCFGEFDELLRLCRVVNHHGAFYATHMRDYKFKAVEAVEEALALAREADVPVQLSHLQVVGRKNWPKLDRILELVDAALADGIDVAMDAYPYLAGSCSLTQLLPAWAQEGGIPALLDRLARSADYERIAHETDDSMANTWADILISDAGDSGSGEGLTGKTIAAVATERGCPPCEAALDLLREHSGSIFIISFNNNEHNLKAVLTHPLSMVITDGLVSRGIAHPRTYGTYPKFLGEYVREKQWLSLEEAIAKTSALAAKRFRLNGRGILRPGNFADIVVLDADRISSHSDYGHPDGSREGIEHVFVNGRFAVRNGSITDELPGVALPHTSR